MSTAKELRQAYHDTYKTILGRNTYNQNLREYCYTPYKGKYYSDCSSSICLTMNRIGVKMDALNTEGMHYDWTKVNVTITNGHIARKDLSKLRVGDALMFRGSDSSRPLKIGHTESIYEINGDSESDIILAGHGSGNPSLKNCYEYCEKRANQWASGGWNKGLVEVLRAIPNDGLEENTKPETNEEYVTRLYKELLGRTPDSGGFTHWVTQLKNGMSRNEVESAFKGSQEYQNLHKNDTNDSTDYVKKYQQWLVIEYFFGLDIDGKCGASTKRASVKAMQSFLNSEFSSELAVDGGFGAATKAAYRTVYKGCHDERAYIIQGLLYGHGYDPNGFDGSFGGGCESALKKYQKDNGLEVDGRCGKLTFASLVK